MLKEAVINALLINFPDKVEIRPGERRFAIFKAKHPEVGDVFIDEDGNELIVSIGEITHGHFGSYDPELSDTEHEAQIAEDLVEFLTELFDDKYYLYRSRFSGGWARTDMIEEKDLGSEQTRWFSWSGPINSPSNLK